MKPAVSVLARVCLPGAVLRRTIRLALLEPELVRREWAEWQSGTRKPEASLRDPALRLRRLIPLLDAGLRRAGVPLDSTLAVFLRMSTGHEKMRWEAAERAARIALGALLDRGIEFLVLRGVALTTSVYPHPYFRHCHDLDLLVAPEQAGSAQRCLAEAGFAPGAAPPGSDAASRWMIHASGFPIGIHANLFRLAPWNHNADPFPDSRGLMIAGHAVRTLGPERMLSAVCVHAATVGSCHSPCWVTDAWHLLTAYPAMDWDRVQAGTPAVPLWLTLDWLHREANAPVPPEVLTSLERQAAEADETELPHAEAAAMLCALGRSRELLRSACGIVERAAWLRRLAWPEASILRWIEHSDAPSPVLHMRRLRRFAAAHGIPRHALH